MNKLNSINNLLNHIKTISEAYRIVEKSTGENFNLFQILGMETAEVKTHSKFLAELLSPKGSHAQGGRFLSLFVEYINSLKSDGDDRQFYLDSKIELIIENSNVEIEKYIGRKTEVEGGRIDISFTDGQNFVCIENKIYAGEGENQLLRYSNFSSQYANSHLFFLTLWGEESKTIGKEGKVYAISYKKHIIEWLEICKKEAVDLPILRETIGQYINLIKKLTHQTTNKKMENDIQQVILKNIEQSKLIVQNYSNALTRLGKQILLGVKKRIEEQLDDEWMVCLFENIENDKQRGKIWLRPVVFNTPWIIGIEDFNPIFRWSNFGKKIFMGIGSDPKTRTHDYADYYKQKSLTSITTTDGFWNTYAFLENYRSFEVDLSCPKLIAEISNEENLQPFVEHVADGFIKYFHEHRDILIDFIKQEQEARSKLLTKNIHTLLIDITAVEVANTVSGCFNKEDYPNLAKIWIWLDKKNENSCLVFDFINGISIDLVPRKDGVEFQLFHRDKVAGEKIKDLAQLSALELNSQRRFVFKYPKEDLMEKIISDAKDKLRIIDTNL